jgi:hypothetical protein
VVPLEGGLRGIKRVPVDPDDDALRVPEEVDLEAARARVDMRLRKTAATGQGPGRRSASDRLPPVTAIIVRNVAAPACRPARRLPSAPPRDS